MINAAWLMLPLAVGYFAGWLKATLEHGETLQMLRRMLRTIVRSSAQMDAGTKQRLLILAGEEADT